MAATTAKSGPTPTPPSCGVQLYDTPVRDVACALPYAKENIDIMLKCCKDADVISYYNNCGLYCLALGQSSGDLSSCLYDKGAKWESVFCRDDGDEKATATGGEVLASAAATVVSSADSNSDDDDDDKDKDKDKDDKDKNDADEGNAAPLAEPQGHITLLGIVIGTMLFSATTFGTLLV
ncbi:uncharacterized protein DNG_07808 [Cephalotrichum gorgonifer]|uniref:Uncharacterized protein n=1 Tax=Cephalotrichum gorgonifer TaxID=2041049 RepID=A0AAE8N4Q4_9PEZI|nr:uncharacterized protein DNG_07808 [Cephalotrichum gorgonifer]